MKGEEKLWSILNDKLDTLRAGNRLPEAIRIAETALEVAKRAFPGAESPLATSFEKLGLLLDQQGNRAAAKGYFLKAHAILEKIHLRALGIREKLHPAAHPDIAQSKCNLAVVYHSRGDYARAAELYSASLKSWEDSTERPPQDYEIVASNYADLLRSLGKARK